MSNNLHIFGQEPKKNKKHLDASKPKDISKAVSDINRYLSNRGFDPIERVPVMFNVLEQMVGSFRIYLRDRAAEDQLKVFTEIHKLAETFAGDVEALMDLMTADIDDDHEERR